MRPYTLPLTSDSADVGTVGGKGASLARLATAGLPVPGGFHVTTAACDAGMNREVTAEITAAYRAMGDDVPVAVRSSATAEDRPDVSFAGQHDTYLGVRGAAAVIDAVERCWHSLDNDRARAYRERMGIDRPGMAVVVQELIDASVSGVMFTEVDGKLVVNSAWGLGETVVGGTVTPDVFALDRDGHIDETISEKTVMAGTSGLVPVPGDLRLVPTLTREQVMALAGLGRRIENLYGMPMDVEWAIAEAKPYILQARPITGRREIWNDSLRGDYLWSNGNLGEAIPSVMTPVTWSVIQRFMADAMITGEFAGHPMCGNIGGRFYMNLSVLLTIGESLGLSRVIRDSLEPVFGRLPEGTDIPLLPLTKSQLGRALLPLLRGRLALFSYARRLNQALPRARRRADDLRTLIAVSNDLPHLWREAIEPYFRECNRLLAAAGRQDAGSLVFLRNRLEHLVGVADANALTSGFGARLESMGPLLGLSEVRRGNLSRQEYAHRWGHRCADELELSAPRPGEDSQWLDRELLGLSEDPIELLHKQEQVSRAAWRRFKETDPTNAYRYWGRIRRWGEIVQAREEARSEAVRAFWVLRDWVRRAGSVAGIGDDVFYLRIGEILSLLKGDHAVLGLIDARRATYDHYRSLPAYPGVIQGRFDPDRWAADPDRRTDYAGTHAGLPPRNGSINGFPGAAGVVEGIARVIPSMSEGDHLAAGEILVTTVTNVGWTPLFPRAAAVVTDIGAPLSHAAIVARELGIPAVVGTGDATSRIRDGARVRVDGSAGTVEVLD
ncbi:PEP/pyruvate-binding domain-containing protein [Herbidospora mongoliensis]|uniref:PEP/pyruvate-binding domain-containing protein n=1 Tax=Herbidospora mongoliensis TaxID=688067 RepID=UPI000831083D|nr:PEP/pyruvate-binding domain-containing protein [Herbidospora mongoliensis]